MNLDHTFYETASVNDSFFIDTKMPFIYTNILVPEPNCTFNVTIWRRAMRFMSRDILAETSAAIAREKISKTAEINGKQVPPRLSSVVSKASIYTVLNLSALYPKANLQFATVRRNLRYLCREVVSLLTFFPLFLKFVQGFQANFFSVGKHVSGIKKNNTMDTKFDWPNYDADEMLSGYKNSLWHHRNPHSCFDYQEQMIINEGRGLIVKDIRGREYLDATSVSKSTLISKATREFRTHFLRDCY